MTQAPRLLATLAMLLASGGISHAQAEQSCPGLDVPPIALNKAQKTFATGKEVVVVALGSSSTEGWMSTNAANDYPAQLQADLSQAFPKNHFAVINRGIGGQDAQEELARLDTDVIAIRPDLVIWQVGANGAMANADPLIFRKLVTTGITRLKSAGIDIILMDNQRSPMILASPEHAIIEQALADIGADLNVPVFSRGSLMDNWKKAGMPYAVFLAADNLHMNDFGYRCVAEALTKALEPGFNGGELSRVAVASHTN